MLIDFRIHRIAQMSTGLDIKTCTGELKFSEFYHIHRVNNNCFQYLIIEWRL